MTSNLVAKGGIMNINICKFKVEAIVLGLMLWTSIVLIVGVWTETWVAFTHLVGAAGLFWMMMRDVGIVTRIRHGRQVVNDFMVLRGKRPDVWHMISAQQQASVTRIVEAINSKLGDDNPVMTPVQWAVAILAAAILSVAVIAFSSQASAAECHSQHEARTAHPNAYLSYSMRVGGHKGEHCWFAGSEKNAAIHARSRSHAARLIHAPDTLLPLHSALRDWSTADRYPFSGATAVTLSGSHAVEDMMYKWKYGDKFIW